LHVGGLEKRKSFRKKFSLAPAKLGMNTEFKDKPKWSSTAVLFQE